VLVTPEADDLVRKLERLIDDDDGRWMLAQRARQRFIDRYAPAVVAEEFAGVFQAAVAPSSGRQA